MSTIIDKKESEDVDGIWKMRDVSYSIEKEMILSESDNCV